MTALETSIENLTAEHSSLTLKLEQIDNDYRVARPVVVNQLTQLARALSALTGKAVAGPSGSVGRKPMSEEGKAAIKAGLERARAAKQIASAGASTLASKPAETSPAQPKAVLAAPAAPKKDVASEKSSFSR